MYKKLKQTVYPNQTMRTATGFGAFISRSLWVSIICPKWGMLPDMLTSPGALEREIEFSGVLFLG